MVRDTSDGVGLSTHLQEPGEVLNERVRCEERNDLSARERLGLGSCHLVVSSDLDFDGMWEEMLR